MGDVAILQPHDCLMHHHALSQRNFPFMTPPPSNKHHKKAHSINGPKQAHLTSRNRNPRSKTTPPDSSKNLLLGQVKILKHGEELPGSTEVGSKGLPLPLPLPPEEFVQSRRVNGFYAGSAAFVNSPPPSSVPLPGFFAKRVFSACDSATNDLRRILRLD